MATVEQQAAGSITVENPATGQPIRSVPLTPPEDVPSMVHHARDVQPAWEAAGFEGRARVLKRAQKWVVDQLSNLSHNLLLPIDDRKVRFVSPSVRTIACVRGGR